MLSQSLYLNSCTSLGDCLFASERPRFAHMHNRLSFEPLSTLASTLNRTFTAPRWISADSSLRSCRHQLGAYELLYVPLEFSVLVSVRLATVTFTGTCCSPVRAL